MHLYKARYVLPPICEDNPPRFFTISIHLAPDLDVKTVTDCCAPLCVGNVLAVYNATTGDFCS